MTRIVTFTARWLGAALIVTAAASGQVFEDVSDRAGAPFIHADGQFTFSMSGGVAWLDMDADGDDDLLLTRGTGEHALFRNDDGVFVDVSAGSGLPSATGGTNTMGLSVGDVDQDGLPDVMLMNNGPNQLMLNRGGGRFEDVTAQHPAVAGDAFSTSGAWADFDRDGDLDFYEGNYIAEVNFPYHVGAANRLLVNEGTRQAPLFVERAAALGVDDVGVFGRPLAIWPTNVVPGAPTGGCTLSVCTLDYDQDGDPDILVGNDFGLFTRPNALFRNDTPRNGPLRFSDVSEATGFSAFPQYNMGINPCDYDHDGDWDLYLSDLGPNLMLRNDDGVFTDVTAQAGPVEGYDPLQDKLITSWGTIWTDIDNDGWEDLYVVNGYIPAAEFIENVVAAPNGLWRNRGDGSFVRLGPQQSGADDVGIGRGVSAADFDQDGWVDLHVINNVSMLPGLLRSPLLRHRGPPAGAAGHHWARFRLAGTLSNREGLGARLELVAGALRQQRQVTSDPVYLSSPSRWVHVGLGAHEVIDRLVLNWPSGVQQQLLDLPADTSALIVEPAVVLEDLVAPVFSDAGAVFAVSVSNLDVSNLDAADREVSVELVVRDASGARVFAAALVASVAGGRTVTVELPSPLQPGDLFSDPVGGPIAGLWPHWTATVRDLQTGARDMARDRLLAP